MAIGNISVPDAATTPVTHVFRPIQDGNDARYINEAGALTLKGQETLGFAVNRARAADAAHSVRVTAYDPTEAVVNGITTVSHGSSADLRFNFSQLSTLPERKDLVKMMQGVLTAMYDEIVNIRPQI